MEEENRKRHSRAKEKRSAICSMAGVGLPRSLGMTDAGMKMIGDGQGTRRRLEWWNDEQGRISQELHYSDRLFLTAYPANCSIRVFYGRMVL